MVNIELLFDGKLKYVTFVDPKTHNLLLLPSPIPYNPGEKVDLKHVRLSFGKRFQLHPLDVLTRWEERQGFHGSLIKKVVLVSFNNQAAMGPAEATYHQHEERQNRYNGWPKASKPLSVRRTS